MNTHDIEPLKYGGEKNDDYVTGWNDCYAAIEAYRKRRGEPVAWENFPGYLIDKCEGETITEEGLQRALADNLSIATRRGRAGIAQDSSEHSRLHA